MILVVGGHSRNIGKTSVVANLIRALPAYNWTAVKITQFGHGVCTSTGTDCDCATDLDHPFALTRELHPHSGTDTARFLSSGARESYWLRTRAGELGFAMPALRRLLDRSPHVIIESNSILQFLRPDLFFVVLDPANPDFKLSTLRYLDRADLFLVPPGVRFDESPASPWSAVRPGLLAGRPAAELGPDFQPNPDVLDVIRSRHTVPPEAGREVPCLSTQPGKQNESKNVRIPRSR